MKRALATLVLALPLFAAETAVKVLILTGASDEPYHHWRETTAAIREVLQQAGRSEVFVNEEPRGVDGAMLKPYAAVILNYNGPRLPEAGEAALTAYVRGGGGFVAFHLASYGAFFGQSQSAAGWREDARAAWPDFAAMVGEHWEPEKIGHARRGVFEVSWKNASHPIAAGLAPRFTANDELYHKLTLAPGVEVLADAYSDPGEGGTGAREPQIWTHRYGGGRVFYTTLGHDAAAFYQPGFRTAFARGVEWAATGAVRGGASEVKPVRLLVVTGGHSYPTAFYAMVDSLGVEWHHAANAEEAYARPLEKDYDAILLHDMPPTTTPQQRERLRAFVEAGHGVVSVHHAIVDYPDWPWWAEQVTGGRFLVNAEPGQEASRYREGVEYVVKAAAGQERHPVLAGVPTLAVHDEAYRGMWFARGITVLMETSFPENDRPVVYVGPCRTGRAVYIQLGHTASTLANPGYRRLVRNAVEWAAGRVN